jgi:hypothetical protein
MQALVHHYALKHGHDEIEVGGLIRVLVDVGGTAAAGGATAAAANGNGAVSRRGNDSGSGRGGGRRRAFISAAVQRELRTGPGQHHHVWPRKSRDGRDDDTGGRA